MDRSVSERTNPYESPVAPADARGKLGWLVMLLILWPIVMAAVGSIIGFFLGRLSFEGIDPRFWNPGAMALAGAVLFAVGGLLIGIRKATRLAHRLHEIHARREELRREVERLAGKTTTAGQGHTQRTSDGRAP